MEETNEPMVREQEIDESKGRPYLDSRKLGIGIGLILMACLVGIFYSQFGQMVTQAGPATEYLKIKNIKEADAKQALLSGEIDMYNGSLSGEDVKELQNNSDVVLYPAASTMLGFYVNPYPATAGEKFNPFALQPVRYAMQFLLDREAISEDVFSGFAEPTVSIPWEGHPDYKQIESAVDGLNINYDPAKAKSLITEAMKETGATLTDNVWVYDDKPVSVIISYSNWNKSSEVADLLKKALEQVGFKTEMVFSDIYDTESKSPEYHTDAAELKWNISISGWIYYSQSSILDTSVMGAMTEDGWWKYENEEISNLEEEQENFKSEEERKRINGELVKKYLEDSTCVWLFNADSVSAARKEVKGLVEDKFIGIGNYTNIREAYIRGKDTLVIGLPKTYTDEESWNHWVVNGIDMMFIVNTVHDPIRWNETVSLKEAGFRWPFEIESKGVDTIMPVPADAFAWNVDTKEWQAVGVDKTAVTKVTYDLTKYLGTKWHDGQTINKADVVFNIARAWDSSFDGEKQKLESDWRQEFFEPIVGLQIFDDKLVVYLNTWSSDENDLVGVARLFQRVAPWELYAATDELVFKERAYDYHDVNESDNEELNLSRQEHVTAIFDTLDKLEFKDLKAMLTLGDKTYAEESDLGIRTDALKNWYVEHNHLYVSDGPFYIDNFIEADKSIDLQAFRDESYPFRKGDWR